VLWWGEDGAVGEEVGVDLVRLPIHGLSRAIVALTNLGPPGWDADDHAWDGGDQRIHLTLRDIAEVPPPAVDDDPPGDDPSDEDPPDEDVASCGCGAGASGWWLIPLVPALARRRRAKD